MLDKIKDLFHQLLTGKDNATHDLGKWSWVVCLVAVLALAGWHEFKGIVVTLTEFWQSLAGVCAAHGASLWAKKDTEPEAK